MEKLIKKYVWGYIPYLYNLIFNPCSEKLKYYAYFIKHGYTHFPYDFATEYTQMEVDVKLDEEKRLLYVIYMKKKLYFPRSYTPEKIAKLYKSLLFEQDHRSPHHYFQSVEELRGKTLLDIGAAEGIITLYAIEILNFAYLFEYDLNWTEALEATFEPWKDKILIVRKMINNKTNGNELTIDDFLKDKPKENIFLKMDIEGGERYALQGAKELFTHSTDLKFAICIYHKKDDKTVVSAFLDKYNTTYSINKELLYCKHNFRECIIRNHKL